MGVGADQPPTHHYEKSADSFKEIKMTSISIAFCLSVTSLAVLFVCTSGQWPTEISCRPQCCEWMNQDYGLSLTSPTPRGFVQTVLPNPEDMLSDPCITVTAQETNQYIEILVETVAIGANSRVCVTVNDNPNPSCGNGQVSYCDQVPSLNMTIRIFCDDSCDLSSVSFWFRVNISQAVSFDDELWCNRRLGDYPSGLITVVTPTGVTDPTEPNNSTDSTDAPQPTSSPEPTSAGTTPSSSLLLMLCIIALTQIYNNF